MDTSEDSSLNSKDSYVTCPLCHGTGQLKDKISLPSINIGSLRNSTPMQRSAIKLKSPITIKLPFIKSKSPTNRFQRSEEGKEKADEKMKKYKQKYILKPRSAHSGGDYVTEKGDFVELLPPPTALRNPAEAIKYAILQVNSDDWEIVMQGLGTMVQVSRMQPYLIEPHMTKVNQTLCNLLHTMRSQVARFACQAAKELFRTMQSTARPEFDEIVQCLLQRTADMNRFIRHDANDALDAMVTYIPPINSVRAIVEKGPVHKNALVRSTVARLLVCIVTMVQVHFLLTLPAYKETRKRIFDAAAILMNDPNMIARNTTKQLFEMMIKDENFDTLFYSEVNKKLLKKIDKALVCLKYKDNERRHNDE